jgi:hypothetical protein
MTDQPFNRPFNDELAPDQELRRYWVNAGCEIPPPADIKCEVLGWYAKWSGARVLVETGTYRGDTTEVLRKHMDLVYTIEASPTLFKTAQKRFADAKNVRLILGDSTAMIKSVLAQLKQKAVFWLDAHWCGQTTFGEIYSAAIMGELEAIFAHGVKDHIIIIDDARFFTGHFGYPSIDYLRRWVSQRRPELVFDLAIDSIRIHTPIARGPLMTESRA